MATRLGRTGFRLYRKLVNGVYRLCSSCCTPAVPTTACVTCPTTGAPTTMHGIITLSGGNCPCANELNGLSLTFTETLVFGVPTWQAFLGNACNTCSGGNQVLAITCKDATHLQMTVAGGTVGFCSGAQYWCILGDSTGGTGAVLSTSVTCSPFQAIFTGLFQTIASVACPCPGATWTLTVTS